MRVPISTEAGQLYVASNEYPAFAAATTETDLKVDAGANKPCYGLDKAGTPLTSLNKSSACLTVKPFCQISGSYVG